MRILICDDDSTIIEQLHNLLIQYFRHNRLKLPEIVSFSSGEALLDDHGEKDLVFLDIEMPGVSGIYVGNELKTQAPDVIIFVVTSYIEYLDDAMRFHVFRYLTKPIDRARLFYNLDDALKQYSSVSYLIAVETKDGVQTVPLSEIVMIEAADRKVTVHTTAQTYASVHNMQYWLAQLPNSLFFQTHRSFLVNMSHITAFDHSIIQLDCHELTAYLTRRKYAQFKAAYLLYLESTR